VKTKLHVQVSSKLYLNHNLKTTDKSFKNMASLKNFGPTVTCQNYINEEIESKLYFGNVSYNSSQDTLSSCLLYKSI